MFSRFQTRAVRPLAPIALAASALVLASACSDTTSTPLAPSEAPSFDRGGTPSNGRGSGTDCARCGPYRGRVAVAIDVSWDGSRQPEIVLLDDNNGGMKTLTSNAFPDQGPAWSPDFTAIAFASARDQTGFDVYVMSDVGSGQKRLTTLPGDETNPTWSPDGKRIAFEYTAPGALPRIYVMNANGSGLTAVTSSTDQAMQPTWSPDGTELAFAMYHAATKTVDIAVRTMTSSFGSMRWVTADAAHDELYPAWSPDGARIAYGLNDGSKIRTVFAKSGFDGGISVEDFGAKLSRPSWSPDGSRMASITTRDYDLVHLEGVLFVDVATGKGEVTTGMAPGSFKGQISWTN